MPKTKEQKQNIIKELKDSFAKQKAMVLVDFEKLDAKTLFKLRDGLKSSGCQITVVKKTLLKKVLEGAKGKNLLDKISQIKGQMALVFGFEDEVAPAKICQQTSKENENLKILGGVLGEEYQSKENVIALAILPQKPELLAKLLGALQAPVSNFVYVLQGNIKGLLCVLTNIKK